MERIFEERGVTVIALDRSYHAPDGDAKDRFKDLLQKRIEAGQQPRVLLDMSGTVSIDSSFIGMLFAAEKGIKSRQGKLAVCGADAFCSDVLRIVKLGSLFPSFQSREEAIDALAEDDETSSS